MENRHLRYFSVLARTLHMTRAAEQLHVAQPALTQNIQHLEQELGATLIARNGRTLLLTEAGAVFLAEAERSLHQFELAKNAARKVARGEAGNLSLGFSSAAGIRVVPRVVKNFGDRYPDIRVHLTEIGAEAQLRALRDGSIDVGIGYAQSTPEFETSRLPAESLFAVLPENHPLARKEDLDISELSREVFVVPSRKVATTLRDAIMAECEDSGFRPHLIQEITTAQTALGMVAAGVGISILPTTIRTLEHPGVAFIPLKNTRHEVRLALLWRRDHPPAALRKLLMVL
nr:LysR family transcriptional regulator [Granulicella sibirica]